MRMMKMLFKSLFFLLLLMIHSVSSKTNPEPPPAVHNWLTLSGEPPKVIGRGGFSGLFPDSSDNAYQLLGNLTVNGTAFCDLQLTKDGTGICLSNLLLDNSTNIADKFPKGQKSYNVNGKDLRGWFAIDFTMKQFSVSQVLLRQNIFSRPSVFDDLMPLSTVHDVVGVQPHELWLNVQYDMFYKEHGLNVGLFVQKIPEINVLSSPEIGFLKSVNGKLMNKRAKLIFRFLEQDEVEPTTKQTYGSILKDLPSIKTYASGILVPKTYIWPVDADGYLEPHTTLVDDAHKLGLEVYAADFGNDMPASYNYTYDSVAEYLQFIDNSEFSVDGFLTDFPSTATESIYCMTKNNNTKTSPALVISHNGASGVFPGCTDLSYQQAVDDGADIIDCSVQMSKDGVAFCLDTADLIGSTTAMPTLMAKASVVPEIQPSKGIFSFDLTWSEIQTLKPQIAKFDQSLPRNPINKNAGKFMQLSQFLDFAKEKAVSGVLINIRNAAYLASKKGLDITEAVSSALSNATLDKQSTQQVLIQSDDTSVLSTFKNVPAYQRVLRIDEQIDALPKQTLDEIKKFADGVNLPRHSILTGLEGFTLGYTQVVESLTKANISLYVSVLMNEYTTVAFDFYSDPVLEIDTYNNGVLVAGIITDYPATTNRYMRSPCSNPENTNLPYTILPSEPGDLFNSLIPQGALPPAPAPVPELKAADVVDPPLPPVMEIPETANTTAPAAEDNKKSAAHPSNVTPSSLHLLQVAVFVMVVLDLVLTY